MSVGVGGVRSGYVLRMTMHAEPVRRDPGTPDVRFRRVAPPVAFGLGAMAALALVVGLGWGLGSLIHALTGPASARLDRPVLTVLVAHRGPFLTGTMQVVTIFGSASFLVPAAVVLGVGWWARRREWRPLALLGAAYLGSLTIYQGVKALTHHLRPPANLALGHFGGFSFPSGHATQAVAVWGMAAAVVSTATSRPARRARLWGLAGLMALLVGLSRLYLGAHWLTDVLAGWALGALWLMAVLAVARRSGMGVGNGGGNPPGRIRRSSGPRPATGG